jgi:hypothetical protein
MATAMTIQPPLSIAELANMLEMAPIGLEHRRRHRASEARGKTYAISGSISSGSDRQAVIGAWPTLPVEKRRTTADYLQAQSGTWWK